MGERSDLGRRGEDAAAEHLAACGMGIVARNWRCASGEIDIVAIDGPVLVFCEVKTRTGQAYGPPLAAITAAKAARLRRLVGEWLCRSHHQGPVRIDGVAILWRGGRPQQIEHVRGIA